MLKINGAMKISFWTKFGIGVKSYATAFKFVFKNGLWVYFFYPITIAIIMFFVGYVIIDSLSTDLEEMVMGFINLDGWFSFIKGFLSFFIAIVLSRSINLSILITASIGNNICGITNAISGVRNLL